jgi:hypothetical protein
MKCFKCGLVFYSIYLLCNHLKNCLDKKGPIKCSLCSKRLTSIKSLKYHLICNECKISPYGSKFELDVPLNSKFVLTQSAFKKFLSVFVLKPDRIFNDSNDFFLSYRNDIKELIIFCLKSLTSLKIQYSLKVKFIRDIVDHISE